MSANSVADPRTTPPADGHGGALVSVVIPAYNRAAKVGAALESVRAQTYPHWEAIVVDDGSKDGTADVVEGMARQDARIRLLRPDRSRGAQAARNVGIRAARGVWIAFLDSDDQLVPDSIECRLRVAAQANVWVVHSECYVLRSDAELQSYQVPPIAGRVYRRLLAGEGPVFPAFLVRRKALKRIGYLDEEIVSFQEWDTAIRLAKYYEFGFQPEPTFIYDCRGDDTISKDLLREARGYEQVVRKHLIPILLHRRAVALARHYQVAAKLYEAAGDERAARRCKRNARIYLATHPPSVFRKLRLVLGGE